MTDARGFLNGRARRDHDLMTETAIVEATRRLEQFEKDEPTRAI
jgi:hypothetical protein